MRMKRELLVAVGAAALTILAGAPNAARAQNISGAPSIASYHAQGRCLDMRASDGQVLLYNCHGGWNQAFRFVTGSYGMISLGDQRCLTSGTASDAPLTVQTCTNASNQRWGFQANGNLRNELGFCADIERGATNSGARVLGYGCHGGTNQQWYPAVTARAAPLGLMAGQRLQGRSGVRSYLSSAGFSGGNIVASGGGNIVSGGAGNLIANDGASIVAGGVGNMLARFGGQLLANDGAGIVAGGAGNALPNNWNFFSGAGAGIVAGGAGN
ncbi:ricin-type beta-trefoil lectin domain protein [Brevundimonas sp. VNH65]|uniref:ricin-type beta-trefoil lectin domain protein n=1 Tax=Brevundimonas sp. VNH65 TaxID=3400917 RepID=UPI003C0191B8